MQKKNHNCSLSSRAEFLHNSANHVTAHRNTPSIHGNSDASRWQQWRDEYNYGGSISVQTCLESDSRARKLSPEPNFQDSGGIVFSVGLLVQRGIPTDVRVGSADLHQKLQHTSRACLRHTHTRDATQTFPFSPVFCTHLSN